MPQDKNPPLHVVQEIGDVLRRMLTPDQIEDCLSGYDVDESVDVAFQAVVETARGILESVGQPTDDFWTVCTLQWAWDLVSA